MPAGVILDTSFFISLADPKRPHHQAARSYWQHFTEAGIPIFLSTIVVSEFCIKQEIPPDILRACVVLPFNWDDAITAATLEFPKKGDRGAESRAALKDDFKIIAQAIVKDAEWIITDDAGSFYKFAQKLKAAGTAKFRPMKLQDGFDLSLLTPTGQREISFDHATDEPQSDD